MGITHMKEADLPERFRTPSVARFADIILELDRSWPNPIMVNPAPLSAETFKARFRDAIKAIKLHKICPHLKSIVDKFEPSPRLEEKVGGQIRIGRPDIMKNTKGGVAMAGAVLDATVIADDGPITSPSSQILHAIITLIQARVLSSATLTLTTEEFIRSHLPVEAMIEVVEKDGTFTLF
jgi:hypothetical protein